MLERELVDVLFVKRWSIVRTLMPQSVAEHSFLVAHYANDICTYLGVDKDLHLAVLQYALWHDMDEQFTGDLPGPNKRGLLEAIGPDAKSKWDARLKTWTDRVFDNALERSGGKLGPKDAVTLLLVVKTADWLEAAVRMATEDQMGNRCATRHIVPNRDGARDCAAKLCHHLFEVPIYVDEIPHNPGLGQQTFNELDEMIIRCVNDAQHGQSRGPWITGEDDDRVFDPALGDREA